MRRRNRVFAVPLRTKWRVRRRWDPVTLFAHPVVVTWEVWGPSAKCWPRVDVSTWYQWDRKPAPRGMYV